MAAGRISASAEPGAETDTSDNRDQRRGQMQSVAAWYRSLNGAVRRCRKHTHWQLHHREMNRTVRLANTGHIDQNSIA
jgi:hypothetical protein